MNKALKYFFLLDNFSKKLDDRALIDAMLAFLQK